MTGPQRIQRRSTAVRLPVDLLDAIDRAAEERILGRNKLVELLLRDGLGRLPDPDCTPDPQETRDGQ